MKALLTGSTGNLGYELALDLTARGYSLVPLVRSERTQVLATYPIHFDEVVEGDLTKGAVAYSGDIDCIVHAAGAVHFRDAGTQNEQMMRTVVALAEALKVPVYFVSTAFVYRPHGVVHALRNPYEKDKSAAEAVLSASNVPHTIFRPSVLVGNKKTGALRNWNGYYLTVRAFVAAARAAQAAHRTLRFPRMRGESNMVPVDEAAEQIGAAIAASRLGEMLYVTNPAPPSSAWVLDETLNFYNLRECVTLLDSSFQEFMNLPRTDEEAALGRFSAHFSPYWSMEYAFPESLCTENHITHEYLAHTLTRFRDSLIPPHD